MVSCVSCSPYLEGCLFGRFDGVRVGAEERHDGEHVWCDLFVEISKG